MRVAVYDRLADVPSALWDAIAPPDFFFGRSFLDVMRESRVEDARYRYVLLLEGRRPVGVAVLTCFTLKLDLLARDPWTRMARRRLPQLMDVPIICCGVPASYGQHHLHLARDGTSLEAVQNVHRVMDDWAVQEYCGMLFWKEWHPSQAPHASLVEAGYLPLPTLPDHRILELDPEPEIFLARLRANYRRQYRAAAAMMRGSGPIWQAGPFRLERAGFAASDAAEFHYGYARVMERTAVRLETYPADFFHRLASSSVPCFTLRFTNTHTGESIAALMYPSGPVLTFGLISKEHARYGGALYRMLLQCMVLYAVKAGFRELRLGQTSGYAKRTAGALPWHLDTLVRVRTPWKHRLLRAFGTRLFPEVASPPMSVYRAAAAANAAAKG